MLRQLFFDIGRNRIGIDPRQFPLRLNAAPPGFSTDLPNDDVRYWHLAVIPRLRTRVRFREQSGHWLTPAHQPQFMITRPDWIRADES
jgi:hypothetical protein